MTINGNYRFNNRTLEVITHFFFGGGPQVPSRETCDSVEKTQRIH